jgi:membrane dipeptidase
MNELETAQELIQKSQVIDLHIDSFIWNRILGYDLFKSHPKSFTNGWFLGQVDLPRMEAAGFSGAMWSITTNPFRTSASRAKTFRKNLKKLTETFHAHPEQVQLITHSREFAAIPSKKTHAVWVSVQGGNALDHDLNLIDEASPLLSRVTLIHLTHSKIGTSSAPQPNFRKKGLTSFGKEFVERLNHHRIFVDLAHADRETFMDAVKVHDSSQPLIVTHTGVSGVYKHWRNIDDVQLKCIADTGGVIGIMYQASFLGKGAAGNETEAVVRHLEHIRKVVGEDFTALGSDWDGMVIPPKGLRSCEELPNLVRILMKRGWSETQIEKLLGQNFLRAYQLLRP